MKRCLHIVVAVLVAAVVDLAGVLIIAGVFDGTLAIGLVLFWGVVVGVTLVGYWEEVIDARAGRRHQRAASLNSSRHGSESKP